MGFKDLFEFNLALLCKTAWRIVNNYEELWIKVLRGLYFPDGDFLQGRKGGGVSWGWINVFEGMSTMLKGLIWSVGNGRKIKIWNDPWIPDLENFILDLQDNVEINEEDKVALLMDGHARQWDQSPSKDKINDEN